MSADEVEDQNTDLNAVEDNLMSFEELRDSPILWSEKTSDEVPGVSKYIAQNLPTLQAETPPPWTTTLTVEDVNQLRQLGNLSMAGLIAEVKKLHDTAYQLGLEEAKEMTRGKYLNIFKN